jgi:hypothetical protein
MMLRTASGNEVPDSMLRGAANSSAPPMIPG